MAPTITTNESGLRSVEELVSNGHEIPERYLNNKKNGNVNVSIPYMDAPSIDLGLLASSSTEELAKLQSVLSTWGCFQLVNHGISVEFLDQVRRVSKEFFGLPLEEKLKYAKTADGVEGYGVDKPYDEHTINWNDRLHLIVYPQHQRLLQFWPKTPLNFEEVIDGFSLKCQEIVKSLLIAMAMSLNLEENRFMEQYGEEGLMFGRFNYYPRCPRADEVLGIKPHTDGTAVTLLLQDSEVEALQVQKDDEWFKVPILPHALFINVGDQMEVMSNGVFKSAFHKVTTSGERDRISVAMLCSPQPDNEIGPAQELITQQTPKLFNNFKNYGQLYFKVDPTSQRPIDFLRISSI